MQGLVQQLQTPIEDTLRSAHRLAEVISNALRSAGHAYDGISIEVAQFLMPSSLPPAEHPGAQKAAAMVFPIWRGKATGYYTCGSWPSHDRPLVQLLPSAPVATSSEVQAAAVTAEDHFASLCNDLKKIGQHSLGFRLKVTGATTEIEWAELNGLPFLFDTKIPSALTECTVAISEIVEGSYAAPELALHQPRTDRYAFERQLRRAWDATIRDHPGLAKLATQPALYAGSEGQALAMIDTVYRRLGIPPSTGKSKLTRAPSDTSKSAA